MKQGGDPLRVIEWTASILLIHKNCRGFTGLKEIIVRTRLMSLYMSIKVIELRYRPISCFGIWCGDKVACSAATNGYRLILLQAIETALSVCVNLPVHNALPICGWSFHAQGARAFME